MIRKTLVKTVAVMMSSSVLLGGFSALSASATNSNKATLTKEAVRLLDSVYQEIGLNESEVVALSNTSIPVNEIYACVYASGVTTGASIVFNTTYRSDFLTYTAYKNGAIAGTNSPIPGGANGSNESYVLCNYSNLSSSNGDVVTLRFEPNNSSYGYSYIVNQVYANTLLANPSVVYQSGITSVTAEVFVPGDVNLDGYINSYDSNLLSNFLAENTDVTFTSNMLKSSDVNHDGSIDTYDLTRLLQYMNGTVDYLVDFS